MGPGAVRIDSCGDAFFEGTGMGPRIVVEASRGVVGGDRPSGGGGTLPFEEMSTDQKWPFLAGTTISMAVFPFRSRDDVLILEL